MVGWEKRNTVGKDRVEELVELYESLGFEVKVELYEDIGGEGEVCDECFGGGAGDYFVIYTRRENDLQDNRDDFSRL